jgi:hypothetical protein
MNEGRQRHSDGFYVKIPNTYTGSCFHCSSKIDGAKKIGDLVICPVCEKSFEVKSV